MKRDIVNFCRKVCKKYKMQCLYIPSNDTYFLHIGGRAIQAFDSKLFYQIPKHARERMYLPLIKLGLRLNTEESIRDSLSSNYKHGKSLF